MIDAKHFLRDHDGTWSTGIGFDDSGEHGKLILRGVSDPVPPEHVSSGVEIARRWPVIRDSLTTAVWAFYLRVESCSTESGPRIDAPEDVWRYLALSEVDVILDSQGSVVRLHGYGRCDWEAEHGLELVVGGDGTPIYLGPYEGWTPSDVGGSNDWNFALKAVQDDVFAEPRRADEEEVGLKHEFAQVQPTSSHSAPPQKKSWWKLWR